MDKTDFLEVAPPRGPIIVLRGNYFLIAPAFDADGSLERLSFFHNGGVSQSYDGEEARRLAKLLNKRFELHIGLNPTVISTLDAARSFLDEE